MITGSPPPWRLYQENVAQFFRDLGLDATTDVTLQGVRTKHAVDVLVESSYKGVSIRWIVECKQWKNPVSKVTILAARAIVEDCGVDRGFVMCESGYQKGALESSYLTNVQLSSLNDLRETCEHDLSMMRVRTLYLRAEDLLTRYWQLDKQTRIDYGLRPDFLEPAYSGDTVVKACEDSMINAMLRGFPVIYNEDTIRARRMVGGKFLAQENDVVLENAAGLADFVENKFRQLQQLLERAESRS